MAAKPAALLSEKTESISASKLKFLDLSAEHSNSSTKQIPTENKWENLHWGEWQTSQQLKKYHRRIQKNQVSSVHISGWLGNYERIQEDSREYSGN